ncbi:MAG: hypothetical protein JWL65_5711, partial [Gammaproteobacteria bacterium]|nr:hypothetical protein [Gammaproteobacteria bacterium]
MPTAELHSSTARAVSRDVSLPSIAALDGNGPIWQQIRRVLARPILSGEWPPGTR